MLSSGLRSALKSPDVRVPTVGNYSLHRSDGKGSETVARERTNALTYLGEGPRAQRGDLHANVAGKISGTCARASAASVTHQNCWSANCACDCHKSGH